ncbi:MAG TPA: cytochrome c-type biogenesis protein [Rhizomicrobium sp.]|jgi:cytochrome c-type biogenesis protein CcmH|nr:cytochrome c-type biogenesis protein [Rhizomicrobium sp.]
MIRLALALLLIAGAANAARAPETLTDPAKEAHARALQKEFRCLVCQGESIDESNAPLAADLRRLIREHIARGDSDDQIRRYLVARYGEFILMKPPLESDTYALWFAPLLVLLAGAAVAALVIRRARACAGEQPLTDR